MRHGAEFQEFYEATYGRIVAMTAAMTGDRAGAEDIAQEAFARALIRWPALRGYDQPDAWVRKVALRIAIDHGRRRQRASGLRARLTAQRPESPAEPGDAMAFTALGSALAALPLRERQVLVLHYLVDLPVETIARDCGLPAGTVKGRLAAGRRHLEQQLVQVPEARA